MSKKWNPELRKSLLPVDISDGDYLFTERDEQGIRITKDMSLAWGPSEIGNENDFSHLWVAYTDTETGEIWITRLDTSFREWSHFQKIIYVPSGSINPSISWDSSGRYSLGVELIPAGTDQLEVWIVEPPYSGDGIRRVDYGKLPILGNDVYGGIYFAYLSQDEKSIYLRHSDNEYSTRLVLKESESPLELLGYRNVGNEINPYHDQYRYLLFYRDKVSGFWPDYLMTSPVDLYTIGLEVTLTDNTGEGISGVGLDIFSQHKVTDDLGKALFLKLPVGVNTQIQSSLGETYPLSLTSEMQGKLNHLSIFTSQPYLKESLGISAQLSGIEWIPTIYEYLYPRDSLDVSASLDGIEWELMLIPLYLQIYSDNGYVSGVTVTMDNQTEVSNEEGLVPFYEIQGNEIYEYELNHLNYPNQSGIIQIPEGENLILPVKIYENPFDGQIKESLGVNVELGGIEWIEIIYENIQLSDSLGISTSLDSILWVEVES